MNALKTLAQQVLELIDLTSLNDNDTSEVIKQLCLKTNSEFGNVSAICIYSRFIPLAKEILATTKAPVKIATVTNFPHGSTDFELAMYETELAIKRGADEVDIVFPYHALLAGDSNSGSKMVKEAKKRCGDKILKVIIESGELQQPALIKAASEISIDNGADFIKTSTGKVAINATIEAAEIMLTTIKNTGSVCGFKVAGGIKTVTEAAKYLDLAAKIMGANWINPQHFRFGASSLLLNVLSTLRGRTINAADNISY